MPPKSPFAVRTEIPGVLRQLRWRIRRYVFLEGLALVVVVLGVSFWFSLGLDYGFELPGVVRRLALVATAGATFTAFVWYLVLRLIRNFRSRALALVLERRFPELNDRLITAVELADAQDVPTPLTVSMLKRTADEAAELSRRLELREVFNTGPLLNAALSALVLMSSIVGFRFVATELFDAWFRRNMLLADEYYRRNTDMHVVVLADPGERIVEFKNGVYKHPRGADLTFLAEVPEGRKVPEQVQYSFRNVGQRGGGGDYMTRIGQRQFRQKLAGLYESIDLSLRGGDFSTRSPFRIQAVDPPQLDRVILHALYPEYTGLNPRDSQTAALVRQDVAVLGTQVSLPAGTDFLLLATTNKPLIAVRIQTDAYEVTFTRASTRFSLPAIGQSAVSIDPGIALPLLAGDGRSFNVPFVLAAVPGPEVMDTGGQVHVPLRLAPDSQLRLSLHDEDDVMTAEPIKLSINSIADEPPHIEARLKGIGTTITRQATIPVVGEIHDSQDGSKVYGVTDDYGVVEARFEYRLEAPKGDGPEAKFQPAPFVNEPAGTRAFVLEEKFRVLPLDLVIGQRFTLKVVAVDADTVTGPHVAAGTPYNFQVVSDDELMALVAVKELNLRRRFEQILDEVKNTRKDLLLHRSRLAEVKELRNAIPPAGRENENREKIMAANIAAATSVDRSIGGIRKNSNETQSIEQEFREIRDELENNAVPDVKPMLDRIDEGIVKPLHSINTLDYNSVDDSLVLLRRVLEEGGEPFARFDESVDQLNLTIEHLEAVLAQMLKLETVNEALQMLRDIIKAQEELQDKTRTQRKKKLIEGLQ